MMSSICMTSLSALLINWCRYFLHMLHCTTKNASNVHFDVETIVRVLFEDDDTYISILYLIREMLFVFLNTTQCG
jgi:hypothetical protein